MAADLCAKVMRYGVRLAKFPSDLVDEREALRCLDELNKVAMTTTILEETKIGRTLNDIRKGDAVIKASPTLCKQCKDTIRRWKSLVIDGVLPQAPVANVKASAPAHKNSSPPKSVKPPPSSSARALESRPNKSDGQSSSSPSMRTANGARVSLAAVPKKPGVGVVTSLPASPSCRSPLKRPTPDQGDTSPAKKKRVVALDPVTPLSPPKTGYRPPLVPPAPTSRDAPRRPGAQSLDQREMDIGQRANNVHTIYSGRKKGSVGKVPSLMTLSMRVLIDNIDCIEETGMPYHVLAPILERASVAQLERLESFNPQVVDDTLELWKRHCSRDFRAAQPLAGESWKECYSRKIEEKSSRLQNLTARIKKTTENQAKEDAKHAAKLTDVTRGPRRKTASAGSWSRPSPTPFARASSSATKPLMAKTMKMLQTRRQMTSAPAKPFGHGRR